MSAEPACPPSERLLHVVARGIEQEQSKIKSVPIIAEKVREISIFASEVPETSCSTSLYQNFNTPT